MLGLAVELAPPGNEDGTIYLIQRPYFRLVGSGHVCVSIFFLLSGFVCSLKPLRLARAMKPEEARTAIAASAFRRVFRLVIPCTIATVISWTLAQFNAYGMAQTVGYDWLHYTSPGPSDGFYNAIIDLGKNCVRISVDDL
jgi:peptidoglycan/LPS O-acetylase OafA/YrhL